jgi:TolB-like protein
MTKYTPDAEYSRSPRPEAGPGADAEPAHPLVSPESVQRHLEKLVVSAEMCRSKKLCQFLRFTVEEVLRGHGSELKEYAIAVGVFRRGREFDPGADPIVRVQARRLRSKLEKYYQTEGRDELVRIEYPVGGYSPVFVRRASSADAAPIPLTPAIPAIPATEWRLAVLPFVDLGPEDGQAFGDGLTDDVLHALANLPGIRVVARASCFQFKGKSDDVRRIGQWLGAPYLISGSVRKEGQRLRVLAQLVDAESGLILWSGDYEQDLESVFIAQAQISREVAQTVQTRLRTQHGPVLWAGAANAAAT